ncbi:DNA polymerase subunit Cdc27-domain-containing protein [Trametes elegans]|nr:DNA polymerase subunit Cdc27-domain-containing protein [Trametes elegans]
MPSLEDYLTKQIYIQKAVVTYRSLSRQLGIHVNAAKTELARFHESSVDSPTRAFATYLVSGELFPMAHNKQQGASTQTQHGMDVDPSYAEDGHSGDEEEEVPTTTVTLVGENDLEDAKSKYARKFSTHVYCLSPSPLTDAGLICEPSAIVYKADAKDAPTSSIVLGRVVGPDVRLGKAPPPVASSSKARASEPASRKPTLKVKTEQDQKSEGPPSTVKTTSASVTSTEKEKAMNVKPKASGKLDWSRAKKTPETDKNKKEDVKAKPKKEDSASPVEAAAKKTAKLDLREREESPKEDSKRGVKRKAAPPQASDTEEKPKSREQEKEKAKEKAKSTPTPTPSDIKLHKNRIVSDSEDESPPPPLRRKANGKGKVRTPADADDVLESEAEKSLRAMMDIDDSLVEKASASRPAKATKPTEDEDVEMASEPEPAPEPVTVIEDDDEGVPKPKPRKKKEKKVIPVGRNGLKKKRTMKTRTSFDAKGYMVTEDYSSYESVDEEEPEETPKKGKGSKKAPAAKAKKAASPAASEDEAPAAKSKPVARTSSTATKSKKSAGSKGSGQGSLKDFFGKPKK